MLPGAKRNQALEDQLRQHLAPANRMQVILMGALATSWADAVTQTQRLSQIAVSHWVSLLDCPDRSERSRTVAADCALLCAAGRAAAPVLGVELPGVTEFWASELGQLLVRHDGFPRRGASQMEAAGVLTRSRPNVIYLADRGVLVRDGKAVTRESLMRQWTAQQEGKHD
jgi:hypothetical protein